MKTIDSFGIADAEALPVPLFPNTFERPADYAAKRRILEIVFLNGRLDDATLVPTIRKPFDVLAEGLISKNSPGDWI